MYRIVMRKSISLLLMAAMVMGMAFIAPSTAVFAEDTADQQQTSTLQAASPTQLPNPSNVKWDGNGTAGWDKVADSQGEYELILYKDDVRVAPQEIRNRFGERIQLSYADDIAAMGNGRYHFTVKAVGRDPFSSSDEVRSALPDYVYTHPGKQLDAPTNLRWGKTPNGYKVLWNAVSGANHYSVRLQQNGKDLNLSFDTDNTEYLIDSQWIKSSGNYTFSVRAISGDIEAIASSNATVSDPEFLAVNIEEIKKQIRDILKKAETDPIGAANDLKQLSNADLATAMQGDSAVVSDIKQIEEKLKTAQGITVNSSVTSSRVSGAVTVVGASFNATGSVVTLKIEDLDPAKDGDIVVDSSQYTNWVKLNIQLDGAKSGNLDVPVQITMPIPTGVSPTRLTILHVRNDGSMETIWPSISGNYATFTVNSFSPFAFVNAISSYTSSATSTTQTSTGGSSGGGSSSGGGTTYTAAITKSVDATVNGNRITIKGQNALGLVRILHGDRELVRGTDYTIRNVEGGVEIRLLLAPGTYDLKVEFVAAYSNVSVTIEQESTVGSEQGSQNNVNANPSTGR